MKEPIVIVALITQIGTLVGIVLSARNSRGAKRAAVAAKNAGQADHAEHSDALETIADVVKEIRRDVAGLRVDDRQTRVEVHDLRQKLNRHLGLGD